MRDELDTLRATFRLPWRVPVYYSSGDLPEFEILRRRRLLARAFAAEGRLAMIEGHPDKGCASFLDAVRFGVLIRSEGVLVDALVGMGCARDGSSMIYRHRNDFSREACLGAIIEIISLLEQAEPFEQFRARDRDWTYNVTGWHGRLKELLFNITGSSWLSDDGERKMFLLERAVLRLLAAELALRAYFIDYGQWPESLPDLVPKYLPAVPVDPFSGANDPFRYDRVNDGFRIYSLGGNGTDEGGQPPPKKANVFFGSAFAAGDLLLYL